MHPINQRTRTSIHTVVKRLRNDLGRPFLPPPCCSGFCAAKILKKKPVANIKFTQAATVAIQEHECVKDDEKDLLFAHTQDVPPIKSNAKAGSIVKVERSKIGHKLAVLTGMLGGRQRSDPTRE